MPFDAELADRVRAQLRGRRGYVEKKMFGGVGFLLHGNMCVGIWHRSLIARIGPDEYEAALTEEHVAEFDITGKPMRGWVLVEPDGIVRNETLLRWIDRAEEFVATLERK